MKVMPGWRGRTWPFAVFFGIVFSWWLSLHWVDACEKNIKLTEGASGCFDSWLNRYQTLVGTLFAVIIAYFTIRYIREQIAIAAEQISTAERHEHERNERREFAARAVLPLALEELLKYAEDCIKLVLDLKLRNIGIKERINVPQGTEILCPRIPEDATARLQSALEAAHSDVRDELADLIAVIQIQRSRLFEMCANLESQKPENITTQSNLDRSLADAIEVHASASSLFYYARRMGPIKSPNLETAAWLNKVHEEDHPRLFILMRQGSTVRERLKASRSDVQ